MNYLVGDPQWLRSGNKTTMQACGREIRHTAGDLGDQNTTWMSFLLVTFCGNSGTNQDLRSECLSRIHRPKHFPKLSHFSMLSTFSGEHQTLDARETRLEPGNLGTLRLEQLTNMGFPDRPSNIQALQMANGDVNQVPSAELGDGRC